MAHLPQIKVLRGNHRNSPVVLIKFAYNPELISRLRTGIPGSRWSKTLKSWIVPEDVFKLNDLFEAIRGGAFIDYSLLKKPEITLPPGYIEILRQKRYSESTIKIYTHYFKDFQKYFAEKDITKLKKEEINTYILELIEKKNISSSQQNQHINAIKFYYERVLGKDKEEYIIERPRKEKTLPDVLSKEDVKKMLELSKNIKHKTLIALIYSCGLRRSEVINLQLADIDPDRKVVKINGAKGKKDRYVQLSPVLLNLLQDYYKLYKPDRWVFEGQFEKQYSAESIVRVVKRAAVRAGILKRVYPHMLRHSYATHQLEQGIDIRYIQQWLGHANVKTTQIYTHVSEQNLNNFKNPLDDLL